MQLSPSMQEFILHWGDMGSRWGLNRSVAQIYALLHLSPDPLTAEEIAGTLNLARSNISNGLKELQAWKLVRTTRELGDRRDYFTSVGDIFDLVETVIEARREREFAPTLTALRDIQGQAEGDDTPPAVRARIAETYEVMQTLDGWYDDISQLPRASKLSLLRIGSKIGALLSGDALKPKKKKKKATS
ncbi:GbsR/MarR family transcriptional regulator [Pseudooceanicola nitratireducens]|uniref:GbsR/MarR family transcriptional regulator n=1 Tax=Pseudooceanicola nitratireducens TaxID=517719 RepID=UPI00351860F3